MAKRSANKKESRYYRYIVIRGDKNTTGTVRAADLEEAKEKVSKIGLVLEVTEAPPGKPPKMSDRDMYFFAFNLANFVDSGFNMLEALTIVKERSANKKVAKIIDHLIFYINRGVSISGAMQLTGSFSPLFVNLVKSGESSGSLTTALKDLADFYKTMIALRGKVLNATLYPLVISGATLVAIVVYMIFVLPTVSQVYNMVEADLPGPTIFVMTLANFIRDNWYWLIAGLVLGFLLLRLLIIRVLPVKRAYERFKFALPVVNKVAIVPDT